MKYLFMEVEGGGIDGEEVWERDGKIQSFIRLANISKEIGRASCRERVCLYV